MVDYNGIADKINEALRAARDERDKTQREASKVYDETAIAARKAYEEAHAPIRKAYEEANTALREKYDADTAGVRKFKDEADVETAKVYNEAVEASNNTYKEAGYAAALEAAKDSDMAAPVARALAWMVHDGVWNDYHSYCLIVLRNLPLDLPGLLKLQADNNWCSDFNRTLERALADNVIDGVTAKDAADHRLTSWLKRNVSYTSTQEELRTIIEQVVKAAQEQAAASLASEDAPLEKVDA